MSQLHKIADANGPKRANIIFVHGLGGDPYGTWRYGPGDDAYWPKWLAAEVPGLAVYALGYEAAISRWSGTAMHLPDRAKNVLEQLLVDENLAQAPIYLFGHSLGGLVIKQMLRIAESEAKHRSQAADFLRRVEKIAFLATPHAGAGQATLGDWLRVMVRPSEATACLVRNDPSLRDLNLWYREWANNRAVPHLILTETRSTRIFGMLVQPDSGDPGLSERPVPIDATHRGICKPLNRNDEVYLQAKAFIQRSARPRADPIVAKIETISDETVAKLMAALDARGEIQNAETRGLERQTIANLARRLRPDETLDFDQATKEIENAVKIAIDAIAKGERGTNQDGFVNNTLARVGENTKAGQFDQAAKEVDSALVELDRRERNQREEMRLSRVTLLEAGIEQDILRRDPRSVARRVEQIVALENSEDAAVHFEALRKRQHTFFVEGRERGVNFSLRVAIEIARHAVAAAHDADQRGAAHNDLGIALQTLGERESGTVRLEEALVAYGEALKEYTRERAPLRWAATKGNLGNTLLALGQRESGTMRLDEALVAYREALKEYTRERAPLRWAATKNCLGSALRSLGARESDTVRLQEAVEVCREALEEWTRKRAPLDWAMTQNNLGNALQSIGERTSGTAQLEEAVIAYREALKERTRERLPLDWAATQNNLGTALSTLGAYGNDTARLEEAVEAFREALKERTRERGPLDWAMSYGNQGVALMHLAECREEAALAEQALGQIETAKITMQAGGHEPFAAFYESQLQRLRALRDRLTKG